MKKNLLLLICVFVMLNSSMTAYAQEGVQKVGDGYTTEGVYYEVFIAEDIEDSNISLCSTSISVTREVIYSGIVTPEKEISWSEIIDGVTYSGVLKLSRYTYTSTQTKATYTGTLYKE